MYHGAWRFNGVSAQLHLQSTLCAQCLQHHSHYIWSIILTVRRFKEKLLWFSSSCDTCVSLSLCLSHLLLYSPERRPEVWSLNSIRDKLEKCANVRHILGSPARRTILGVRFCSSTALLFSLRVCCKSSQRYICFLAIWTVKRSVH